jgi:hypothetical protein
MGWSAILFAEKKHLCNKVSNKLVCEQFIDHLRREFCLPETQNTVITRQRNRLIAALDFGVKGISSDETTARDACECANFCSPKVDTHQVLKQGMKGFVNKELYQMGDDKRIVDSVSNQDYLAEMYREELITQELVQCVVGRPLPRAILPIEISSSLTHKVWLQPPSPVHTHCKVNEDYEGTLTGIFINRISYMGHCREDHMCFESDYMNQGEPSRMMLEQKPAIDSSTPTLSIFDMSGDASRDDSDDFQAQQRMKGWKSGENANVVKFKAWGMSPETSKDWTHRGIVYAELLKSPSTGMPKIIVIQSGIPKEPSASAQIAKYFKTHLQLTGRNLIDPRRVLEMEDRDGNDMCMVLYALCCSINGILQQDTNSPDYPALKEMCPAGTICCPVTSPNKLTASTFQFNADDDALLLQRSERSEREGSEVSTSSARRLVSGRRLLKTTDAGFLKKMRSFKKKKTEKVAVDKDAAEKAAVIDQAVLTETAEKERSKGEDDVLNTIPERQPFAEEQPSEEQPSEDGKDGPPEKTPIMGPNGATLKHSNAKRHAVHVPPTTHHPVPWSPFTIRLLHVLSHGKMEGAPPMESNDPAQGWASHDPISRTGPGMCVNKQAFKDAFQNLEALDDSRTAASKRVVDEDNPDVICRYVCQMKLKRTGTFAIGSKTTACVDKDGRKLDVRVGPVKKKHCVNNRFNPNDSRMTKLAMHLCREYTLEHKDALGIQENCGVDVKYLEEFSYNDENRENKINDSVYRSVNDNRAQDNGKSFYILPGEADALTRSKSTTRKIKDLLTKPSGTSFPRQPKAKELAKKGEKYKDAELSVDAQATLKKRLSESENTPLRHDQVETDLTKDSYGDDIDGNEKERLKERLEKGSEVYEEERKKREERAAKERE